LEQGKSSGPDDISAEHIAFAHPVLLSALVRVFNLILFTEVVPDSFCDSFIVPIPKSSYSNNRIVTCDDFRGIAISSVFSKLFESCVLDIFDVYLPSECNQFGFKEGSGCSHAVFCAKKIISNYVGCGNTANILALDISKAFPRVNHHALLSKLIARKAPLCLVNLIDSWLSRCISRVRWCGIVTEPFPLRLGVNQGSVLAPVLFAILINDVIVACNKARLGEILVYADDILIVAKSISTLQSLFNIVQAQIYLCNMSLNVGKCCAMRVGPRFDAICAPLTTDSGDVIRWVDEFRYLGIYFVAGSVLKFSVAKAKASFNRAVNGILSKVLSVASEELILHLIKVKCLPVLLYCLHVCDLNKSALASLDFCVMRFGFRIFKTSRRDVVADCFEYMGLALPSKTIPIRSAEFTRKLDSIDNAFLRRTLLYT
jgi:hypothetical protein